MFTTLKELIQQLANGTIQMRDDEYIGDDGIAYCKACKTPRFYVSEDKQFTARCACKCQAEEAERREKEEKRKKHIEEFNKRKSLSLLGARYKNVMFENAVITDNNRAVYEKCTNYVNHSKEARENNIGLYIHGDNSSGKTYLTACICNELLWKGWQCVYTNLATILNEIRSSYDGNGAGECELLDRLRFYDFAFIDDLGKEFIGREFNPSSAKWAEGKLFEVINARYNAQKPTIFSSNYTISDLASVLGLDKAIVERIDEMATRVIKLEGDDFRQLARKEKSDLAKKLGI